jgi:hypothetical protein
VEVKAVVSLYPYLSIGIAIALGWLLRVAQAIPTIVVSKEVYP